MLVRRPGVEVRRGIAENGLPEIGWEGVCAWYRRLMYNYNNMYKFSLSLTFFSLTLL